jgi:clan AA aspartic protease (TIGR02281 family)
MIVCKRLPFLQVLFWVFMCHERVSAMPLSLSLETTDLVRLVSLSVLGSYLIIVLMRQLGGRKFFGLLSLYAGIMGVGIVLYTFLNRSPDQSAEQFGEEVLQTFNPSHGIARQSNSEKPTTVQSNHPQVPAPIRVMRGSETVSFKKSLDGHFYVSLRVGGETMRFLLDTGATRVIILESDARKIGVDMASLEYKYPVHTANGTIQTAFITLSHMTIGSLTIKNVAAAVAKGEGIPPILGMSFLDRIPSWTIKGDQLIFTLH